VNVFMQCFSVHSVRSACILSDSGILRFLSYIITKQKEQSIVFIGVSNSCINTIPDW